MGRFLVKVECPDGYEPAYGEDSFRPPKKGELFVSAHRTVLTAEYDWEGGSGTRLVVRPVWMWPKWLKARWIAMDGDDTWFAFECEPTLAGDCWKPSKGMYVDLSHSNMFDFTPPSCDGYRSSLRHNPYVEMKT